jgi:hypothetical protein
LFSPGRNYVSGAAIPRKLIFLVDVKSLDRLPEVHDTRRQAVKTGIAALLRILAVHFRYRSLIII